MTKTKQTFRALALSFIFLLPGTAALNAQSLSVNQGTLPNRGCATGILPQQFETWLQGVTPVPGKGNNNQTYSVFNIPVIVHVIHNNEPVNSINATSGGNLNAAQILDQINILNNDFNSANADTSLIPAVFKPRKGNFQFNFCLAVVNPTGGVLAEPGIDRVNRVSKGWTAPPYATSYITSTIKPGSIWDPNRYMNIWVCAISGGVLGYATFPQPGTSGLQGLTGSFGTITTDGVVMRNTAFGSIGTSGSGPYNKGRTATHEVGHWLGLRHIWGDGTCATDYCADTPPAQNANYNCPTHPHKLGTCSGNTTGEMTMNYMDYTNDACMYMFSKDQKNRAQLIMTHSPMRLTLLTSTVCNAPTTTNDIGIMYMISPTYSQVINCNNNINPSIRIHNFGSNAITTATYSYNLNGINTMTGTWTGSLQPGTSATVTLPAIQNIPNGSHTLHVGFYSPNGNSDPNPVNNYNNQEFSVINSFTLNAAHSGSTCASITSTLSAQGSATGYTWNPGALTGSVVTINPGIGGNYIYTLTASNGSCSKTSTISVNIVANPSVIVNSPSVCSGGGTGLTASGACSYTWLPGNLSGNSIGVNPSVTTEYTLIATGCNGCQVSRTTTVTVVPQPVINVNVSPSGSLCLGGTATLTASGASAYNWNTGSTANNIVVSPSVNTTFTVTGNNGSCSTSTTAMVSVGASSLKIDFQPDPAIVCIGETLILNATGAVSYTWNSGANSSSVVVTPSANITLSLTGTNGACSASAAITVSVMPFPTITVVASPAGSVCAGSSVSLSASGASSYLWDNGSSGPVLVVTPTISSTYTVSGISNGCSVTNTISITVGGAANPVAISSSAAQVCAGVNVILSATGANSYTWMNGSNATSVAVNPTITSNYSVSGTNNGCNASAAITISVTPAPALSVTALPSGTICAGQSVTLAASGDYSVFAWSPGSAGNATHVVTPSSSGTYSVTGSGNSGGCSDSKTIHIVTTPGPVSKLTSSNTICSNPCTGMIHVVSSGGLPPYTYSLNTGPCTSMPCGNLCTGFYTLETRDSLDCRVINFFSIECNLNTGLSEQFQNGLLVYPNPVKTDFTIENENSVFDYKFYGPLGQLLLKGNSDNGRCVVKTAGFAPGIYLLEVSSGGKRTHRKVLIE